MRLTARYDREIAAITLPAIAANVAEPLLGLADTAIAGHLGSEVFIGAATVGAMLLSVIYWHFGFLRMGTSGITAQAFGAGDHATLAAILKRTVRLALALALLVVALQSPLRRLALWVVGPGEAVGRLAGTYFDIVVWGAPAVLMTMVVKGWLLGMQDARAAMTISIGVNVLNVLVSLVAVYAFDMGFTGIAVGTLAAVWTGLAYSCALLWRKYRHVLRASERGGAAPRLSMGVYIKTNGDIFVRSFFMMAVTLFFTSAGARASDTILAVNSLMTQLFLLYSYLMDGIAFAGEAVVGKYQGRGDTRAVSDTIKRLFFWATLGTIPVVAAYALLPHPIYSLLTDVDTVVEAAMDYRWWCAVVPVVGMAAFVWDGVFVGLTRTRGMLLAVVLAAATFFALFFTLPASWGNHRLWTAFIAFLSMRSLVQTVLYVGLRR